MAQANAGHVSLDQLKVMSAIESCRTAALGGHVARCEDCAYTPIAYNSCRNRHCPKCQGAAAKEWLADREAELLPVPYYHVVFTLPARDRRHRLPEQGRDLRPPVQGHGRDAAHDRRRSRSISAPGSASPSVLHTWGSAHDPPPACPHDRAGRRHLARWPALDLLPAGLLPAGARALAAVPAAVPGDASPPLHQPAA